MIIDMDSHFEPSVDWLDSFPRLKEVLPEKYPESDPRFALNEQEMFAWFVSDDLLRHVPPDQRIAMRDLVTEPMGMMFDIDKSEAAGVGYEGATMYPQMTDIASRVNWLDRQGIAKQTAITGMGYTLARAIEDPKLGMETLEAVNTWMAENSADYRDRILPVTTLRYEDPDWAVREMGRMRELGSRAFMINAEPVNGIPPTDPSYDRVWSAAVDLGMVGIIHVGLSPSTFHPGWARSKDPAVVRLLSILNPHQAAEVWLTAMIFEGVFERHPKLTIQLSEQGTDWLPRLAAKLDGFASPQMSPMIIGQYKHSMLPSEFIRRNIRISPLPTMAQPPADLVTQLPDSAVFASDYPHFEGSGDPTSHYTKELAEIPEAAKEGFYSGNILRSYEQMGDPLL